MNIVNTNAQRIVFTYEGGGVEHFTFKPVGGNNAVQRVIANKANVRQVDVFASSSLAVVELNFCPPCLVADETKKVKEPDSEDDKNTKTKDVQIEDDEETDSEDDEETKTKTKDVKTEDDEETKTKGVKTEDDEDTKTEDVKTDDGEESEDRG